MRFWIANAFDALPNEHVGPTRCPTLCRVLAQRGHDVLWWSAGFAHGTKQFREPCPPVDGFAIRLLPVRPYYKNVSVQRMRSHFDFGRNFYRAASDAVKCGELERPDAIIFSSPPLEISHFVMKLRRQWGCKAIMDVRDAWPEAITNIAIRSAALQKLANASLMRPYWRAFQRACHEVDGLTGVARFYVEFAQRHGARCPTHLTYLGADLLKFAGRDLHRSLTFNCSKPPIRFLYLGGLGRAYDLETVIEAADILRSKGSSFTLTLAGKGEKRDTLRAEVRRRGLENSIRLHDFLRGEAYLSLVHNSDVAISPIVPETLIACPNKACEYAAAGLPQISSLPGEMWEMLERYDAGAFYEVGNARSLAAAMRRYVQEPELARAQGANARAMASELFDREKTYPHLAAFCERVALQEAG